MGGSEDLCCGIVGEQWSCFCLKTNYKCTIWDHRKKMWKYTNMVDGYYRYYGTTSIGGTMVVPTGTTVLWVLW